MTSMRDRQRRRKWSEPDLSFPLARSEVRLLDAMAAHADADGLVSIGARTLVARSGAGCASTVRYALRWLAERGAIERVTPGSNMHPTTWRVLMSLDKLAAVAGLAEDVILP